MRIERVFIISCPYFGGFKISVDINQYETTNGIIEHVLTMLKETLTQSSLESLVDKLSELSEFYHIHDYEFGYMLINQGPYYICNHCAVTKDMIEKSIVDAKVVDSKVVDAKVVDAKVFDTRVIDNCSSIDSVGVDFTEGLVPLNSDEKKEDDSSKESSNPINGMISMYNSLVNNNYSKIDSNDDIDYREK